MDALHRPLYTPHILANALNHGGSRPLLHLPGGPPLTVAEVRDRTSQYLQALSSLGVGRGTRVAMLSPNPGPSACSSPRPCSCWPPRERRYRTASPVRSVCAARW